MSDRRKSTPHTAPVPPELQPRCIGASPAGERCVHPADHIGQHETESGERWWGEPYPSLPAGAVAEEVALRRVFRLHLLPEDAEQIEKIAGAASARGHESDAVSVTMVGAVEAAAEDLALTADYLDYMADDRGDGPERDEIQLAATVLDVQSVLAKIAAQLREEVGATRQRQAVRP